MRARVAHRVHRAATRACTCALNRLEERMNKPLLGLVTAQLLLAAACGDDATPPGPTPPDPTPTDPAVVEPRERELRGGRVHATTLAGVTDVDIMDPAPLVDAVQAELRGRLGALRPTDFVETGRELTRAGGGARLSHVMMRQSVAGIPVEETYLNIGVRFGQPGAAAQVVSSSYRVFDNVRVDTSPSVTRDRAIVIGRQALRVAPGAAPGDDELVIRKLGDRLQLAWKLRFAGSTSDAYVIASGRDAGRVHAVDRRVFETSGSVVGQFVRGGAPGALGVPDAAGLAGLNLSGGGATAQTGADGTYTIEVPDGTPLTATLAGRASTVFDLAGAPVTATAPAVYGGETSLLLGDPSPGALAQVTAYHFVEQVRAFAEANGLDGATLGAPLDTNVNLPDVCNAYFDPWARSINFFQAGGGCNNSATDSVVAHEYGHFVDDAFGGIWDGGLSEGWGDLLSCLALGAPEVGFDLFPGTALRSCDNTYVYPPGGGDEVHNLGQAWAGFGWDVRQNLIATMGADGEALARALLIPSLSSNAPDIPTAVREAFLRDDDDGDLSNQTPHWDALYAAAERHGLVFAIDPDLTPPAAVTDLTVVDASPTQLTLSFTAPGDDGAVGTAAAYEVRWATFPIDETNFYAATVAPTGAPLPAGSTETISIATFPGATVWVALVAIDEQYNTSGLSNVVSATTEAGTPVWQDGAEADTGWTTTGLWHVTARRASEGAQAFWYGDEATGTFDTPGTANSGQLTSPVIDLSGATAPVLVIDQFLDVEEGDFYDRLEIRVINVDDPSEVLVFGKETGNTGGVFAPRGLPLTGFDDDRVQLVFAFDTVDSIANQLEGWYVDNLRIYAADGCAHGVCFEGEPLDPTCSPCAETVCAVDSYCCTTAWDALCVQEAQDLCGATCSTCGNGACEPGESPETCPADCQPTCAHGVCEPGVPLEASCDSCVATVCAADDFCCTTFWDRVCVEEAEELCGATCQGCAHDQCSIGEPLTADCDDCTTAVCAADPYCCTTAWDSRCVAEAADTCGLTCETCSHDPCSQGTALEASCDPCVGAVCAADPYCCTNTWDERCIEAAQTTCGLSCANVR